MLRLRPIVALVLVIAVQALLVDPHEAQAQGVGPYDNSPDDTGLWLGVFDRGDISHDALPNRYKWWFDGHARFFDDRSGYGQSSQSIVRPGIGYDLNDQATVWAGYGWIRSSRNGTDTDEHRFWQQLTWSQQLEPVTVGVRSRLEQRFLERESETAWRFRQLLSWRHELQSAPQFSLVIWNEVFINLNNTLWGGVNGFDQNRLFFGFGRKCGSRSRSRVEIGYLYQRIQGWNSRGPTLNNHLLSVNLYRSP